MKSQNNHPTNFWFGFALGTLTTAAAVYLLGTKQGREKLKKIIDLSENIEELSPELIAAIPQALGLIANKDECHQKHSNHDIQEKINQKTHTMENVIDKIKQVTQPDKYVKKFFAKGGKIIDP